MGLIAKSDIKAGQAVRINADGQAYAPTEPLDLNTFVVRYVTTEELDIARRNESYIQLSPQGKSSIPYPGSQGINLDTERLFVLLPGERADTSALHIAAIAKALGIEDDVLELIDAFEDATNPELK